MPNSPTIFTNLKNLFAFYCSNDLEQNVQDMIAQKQVVPPKNLTFDEAAEINLYLIAIEL